MLLTALNWVSFLSCPFIVAVAILHSLWFLILLSERKHRIVKMATGLKEILDRSGFGHSSMGDHVNDDSIDGYCEDLLRELKDGKNRERLSNLSQHLTKFDELKPHTDTSRVQRKYNVARTAIEFYPLFGILGTVIALAAGLTEPSTPTMETAQTILQNFGQAIWSTILGLFFGVIFMFGNSWVELGFERLADHRQNIGDVVLWAHKVLGEESAHEKA